MWTNVVFLKPTSLPYVLQLDCIFLIYLFINWSTCIMFHESCVMCHLNFLFWQSGMSWLIEDLYQQVMNKHFVCHLLLSLLPLVWVQYSFLCVHLIQRRSCDKCWYVSRKRLRQEMHMKRLNDKMLKHTINILACLSFVCLKDFKWFVF